MRNATQRPVRKQANACAMARPWVKPQEGVTRDRKVLRDGSVRITRTEIDHRGVVRRTVTVLGA